MYLMSYFRTDAEALHSALSADGLQLRALNGNRPVYRSQIGRESIRDPFIILDRLGVYHLLSTNSWREVNIFHAASDNLIEWRNASLIPAMETVPGTQNCWAPEAIYDPDADAYRIFWSSTTPLSGGTLDPHGYNHRIWNLTTADFVHFSEPSVFFDPGYNVIDATIASTANGTYLMAFKDERGEHTHETPHKAMRVATSDSLKGPWTVHEPTVTPPLTEGPLLFYCQGRWLMFYDHFVDGHFGASESVDGLHWRQITPQVQFPDAPRHASVVEIDDDRANALLAKFG
jgi:beta-galactosidase